MENVLSCIRCSIMYIIALKRKYHLYFQQRRPINGFKLLDVVLNLQIQYRFIKKLQRIVLFDSIIFAIY